jgi:CheY-like chemotaxis protein
MALTLLYVREESAESRLQRSLLESDGYQVLSVISGSAALSFLEAESPALIIVDHQLPDMTGVALAQTIRRFHPTTPIILESSIDQLSPKDLEDVDVYFLKSDSPNLLLRFVNLLLRDRRAAKAGE